MMRGLLILATLTIEASALDAATLVLDGQPKAAVFVAERILRPDEAKPGTKADQIEAETQRRRLRESVKDLAHYLGKMSGAKVEVRAGAPAVGELRLPILVGELAEKAYGPVGKTAPYRQAFRVVVSPQGLGLYGESDLASSYAVYELLDRLGCRWYMPGELGEVVPSRKTIDFADCDQKLAPGTIYRGVWYADDAFKRRNRMGGLLLNAGHALEMLVSKEDRAKHPEWKAEIDGKPHEHRLRWSSKTLAAHLADKIAQQHADNPQPSYSLSPDDGANFDESKDDRALDAGDFDTANQVTSITDRLMVLTNRIAEAVTAKHPDVLFGVLAYAQYTRPPVREKVHPAIVPQIAPIAYSRAHPMTDDAVPDNKQLRALIEGWASASKMTSMYAYAFNLAETSAPQPMLTKWAVDVPFALRHKCQFWQPETLPNFEIMMHALYMANRLAWDPSLKPEAVYAEIEQNFYGAAATRMSAYWKHIDEVWVKTPEYSGCGFGYLRRWTPERMVKARELMNAALVAGETLAELDRVRLADESLRQFELFIKLRRDLAEGRFATLALEADTWRKRQVALGEKYKDSFCFSRVEWTPHTVSGKYFASFYQQTYDSAAKIAAEKEMLTPVVRTFRYQADKEKSGEAAGWAKPDFDDSSWKTTDVSMETWSTIGYHDWFKSLWYRTTIDVPAAPPGKKVWLWIGATDGSAKVFVNGTHVPFVDAKGKTLPEANGYCQPFSFDVTNALKPGKNQVSILCTRTFFNELGTGGLLAPVLVYRDK